MSELRKKALIDQLFTVGNLPDEFATWIRFSISVLRNKYPIIAESQWLTILQQFAGNAYLDNIKQVYANNFTEEEIEQVIKFWSSTAGRKLVRGSLSVGLKNFNLTWANELEEACKRLVEDRSTHDTT
jgi:hypothetical protein